MLMENNNGADKLISSILQEAHEQAAAIEWHSAEAIAAIKKRFEESRDAVRDEFTKKAEDERRLAISTARTNAELSARKELLAGKRALIDKAYSEAYGMLCAIEGEKRNELLLKLLRRECGEGDTVRPSKKDRDAIEKLLPEAGAGLTLGDCDEDVSDGFSLVGKNYYKNCSFAALMDDVRAVSESDVVTKLFGE